MGSTRTPPLRMKVNSMKRKKKHKLQQQRYIFKFLWFISKKLKSSSKIKISSTVFFTPKNYSLLFITFFLKILSLSSFLKKYYLYLFFLYIHPTIYMTKYQLCQIYIFSNHPVQRTQQQKRTSLFSYFFISCFLYKIMIINYHPK